LLYLAVLFHDIAKPITVSGHEIVGAEIACSIMERTGYDQREISIVQFLVRHHLSMEQTAFRRNLNDPSTLNKFAEIFTNPEELDLLYLLTYADLSAVSSVVWTQWKSDLLYELYNKTKIILEDGISGEEILHADTLEVINGYDSSDDESFKEHIASINDLTYLQVYSEEEINQHVKEIEKGLDVSVFFKEDTGFTNITVITRDSYALLSRLCGALSINDLNIHDAKIFTRTDGIIIDNFNVTDFRSKLVIEQDKYGKIKLDLVSAVRNELAISKEFYRVKSKWKRIEEKFFRRKGKIKIVFERHEKYTIIDVFSPDRLGLLYQITKKLHELGLSIFFAKIATKGDDVVDAFYLLDRYGKKISYHEYELIKVELTKSIEETL
jgi:[protein-PII] uridylyltransferase